MRNLQRVKSIIVDVSDETDDCGRFLHSEVYFKFDTSERTYAAADFNAGDMKDSPIKDEVIALAVAIKSAIKKNQALKILGEHKRINQDKEK